jgi:hypothetical protein
LSNLDHLLEEGVYELDLGTSPSQSDHPDALPVSGPPGHHQELVEGPRKATRTPKVHAKTGSPTDGPVDLSFLDSLPALGSARGLKAVRELQRDLAGGRETHGRPGVKSASTPTLDANTSPGEGVGEGEESGGAGEGAILLRGGSRKGAESVSLLKQGGRILSPMTTEGAAPLGSTPEVVTVDDLLAGILADG